MNPSSVKKHLMMLHRLYFKTLSIYGEKVNPKETEKVKELQGILQYVQTKCRSSVHLVKGIGSKSTSSKKKSSSISNQEEYSLGKRSPLPSPAVEQDVMMGDDPFSLISGILEPQAQRRNSTFDSFEEPISEPDTVQQHFFGVLRPRTDSGQGRDLLSNMPESPPEPLFEMPFLGFDFKTPPGTPEATTAIEPLMKNQHNDKQVPIFCPEEDHDQIEDVLIHDKSHASEAISTAEMSQAPISFGILVTRPIGLIPNDFLESLAAEDIAIEKFDSAFERQMQKAISLYQSRKSLPNPVPLIQKPRVPKRRSPKPPKPTLPMSEFGDLFYLDDKYNMGFQEFDPPFWIPEGIHDMEEFQSLSSELQQRKPQPPAALPPAPAEPEQPQATAPPAPALPAQEQAPTAPMLAETHSLGGWEETASQHSQSRASSRTRGAYNMLALPERLQIVSHSLSHGLADACKTFNLSRSRVKRYIKNGVVRKTGGGRKTLDPRMEELLLGWIEDNTRETGVFPAKFLIKTKAVELTTVSHFRGSKGWCDKFLKRNQARLDVMKEMYVR